MTTWLVTALVLSYNPCFPITLLRLFTEHILPSVCLFVNYHMTLICKNVSSVGPQTLSSYFSITVSQASRIILKTSKKLNRYSLNKFMLMNTITHTHFQWNKMKCADDTSNLFVLTCSDKAVGDLESLSFHSVTHLLPRRPDDPEDPWHLWASLDCRCSSRSKNGT